MTSLATVEPDETKVLAYLGLNPNNPADQAAVAVARNYNLDPVLKHVVVIPRGGVYITRDGLLHVAHRSGQLDGIVVEQEPTFDERTQEWVAKVSVYRKDMRHPFTFPGRYPASGGNKAYAPEMALKSAEAHALRRAFDVSGLPTYDEDKPDAPPMTHAEQVAPADLLAQQTADDGPPDEPDTPLPIADGEPMFDYRSTFGKAFYASINSEGIPEQHRIRFVSEAIGRPITSTKELTDAEARDLLDNLPALAANFLAEVAREGAES